MSKALILGYGNPDREDDGVAWHILANIHASLGRPTLESPEDDLQPEGDFPHLYFTLQLTPEMAELVSQYDQVCFVDAHTGNVPEEISFAKIKNEFQNSPFTHHLTPASCLSLCEALYQSVPNAVLASVRGYSFGFSRQLSPATSELVPQVVHLILKWLSHANQDREP